MGKLNELLGSKKFMLILSLVGLYLLSTGTSWALFSYLTEEPSTAKKEVSTARQKIGEGLPKTEECPINGVMYSKPERDIWETRRPLTAVIENHLDARPQSGLSKADVVYEVVAEGGITRFLGVFYCGASAENVNIAPVRSSRVYLISWAAEYGDYPLYFHIGGANNICKHCPGGIKPRGDIAPKADAYKLSDQLGWWARNDLNAETNIGYPAFKRDQYRLEDKSAWEHAGVGVTDEIFKEAERKGFGFSNEEGDPWNNEFIAWKFADDAASGSPKASDISFTFWDGKSDYDVGWKYDAGKNAYLRSNGGKEHIDHETGEQLTAKNVVVMFVDEEGPIDKEGHMYYTTTGQGNALFFRNGEVHEGNWKKKDLSGRTRFYDEDGEEIKFVRGLIWIEAVPEGNTVNY